MTKILVVSAGMSQPSSTRLLADRLASATRDAVDGDLTVDTVELRTFAHDITDHMLVGFAAPKLREVLDKLEAADGLILVTPTFTASYSGLFKSFIDIVDPDVMRDKPVVLAATGGTERHSLVLEYALRPLMAYLRAAPVATAVYAASSDWGNETQLQQRIERAAEELAIAMSRRPATEDDDPFVNPVPFTQLLSDAAT